MTRLKDVAVINRAALPETADPDRRFRYVDIGSVGQAGRVGDLEELRFADAPSRARRLVRPGDSIVSTVRTYLRAIAHIGHEAEDLVVSTGFATLTPRPGVDPRFLKWAVRCNEFVEEVVARSVGVSYPAITATDLGRVRVRLPALDEQQRIADYLDAETARIDELIAEQVQLMRLLDDRLNVYIAQAVVGADVAGRKVASQVPWWPALPVGWETWKLARACGGITVGVVVNPSTYVDEAGEVPFIRGTDVRPWHIAADSAQRMTVESNRLLAKSTLRAGDLVVVRVGAPGTAAVVPDELDGANCASLLILRRGPADPGYLAAVLNSSVGRDQIRCMSNGAAQEQVNAGDIAHLVVPFPPLDDQRRVADSVQRERTDAARITAALDHQIDLLQEHRQALITHAVTQGIDGLPGVA